MPLSAQLALAVNHHLAGRLGEAERIYSDALRANPNDADALHLLGHIAAARGQPDLAMQLITRAIVLKPHRGDFHAGLGLLFYARNMQDAMVEAYRHAMVRAYFSHAPAPLGEILSHAGNDAPPVNFLANIGLYKSQYFQDVFLDRWLFGGLRDGVFIDIGAHDGVTFSNTYFFEKARGWRGVCVEPNPAVFVQLQQNRQCVTLDCCVAERPGTVTFRKITGYAEMLSGIVDHYDPDHNKRIESEIVEHGGASEEISVVARTLNDIADEQSLRDVTYLGIDTEGSELAILRSTDFSRLFVHVMTVECNFEQMIPEMAEAMGAKGFDLARAWGRDLVFINRASPYHAVYGRLHQGLR